MNDTALVPQQLGQRTEQMGVAITQRSGEMAANAMAAKQKALIEARYVIAYNRPRSILQARSDILAACQRPGFAESARYSKPVGGTSIEGFSIRFAEEAIKAMKNVSIESTTIYEDDEKRTVQVAVTDLESNVVYGKEITVAKTVERKQLKSGQVPISKRTNSAGETTYLVNATEDEIANKIASAESKIIRNCGLRLVPSDILEEAEAAIAATLESGGVDRNEATKKVVDAFGTLNIGPVELEKYLKHGLATISPKELNSLRAVFTTIKEGSAAWADYITEDGAAKTKPNIGAKPSEPAAPKSDPTPAAAAPAAQKSDPAPKAAEPKAAKKPAAPKVAPPPEETSAEPPSNDDGDLGPQEAAAPVEGGRQYAVTPELDAKLKEMGVSDADFDKWVLSSGRADAWSADSGASSTKLLADERALKKLNTLYGAE